MAELKSINISLPESMKTFVEAQVSSGGFGTVSEYVRTLIREAQRAEGKRLLETKLLEALDSEATPLTKKDWTDLKRAVRDRYARRKRA